MGKMRNQQAKYNAAKQEPDRAPEPVESKHEVLDPIAGEYVSEDAPVTETPTVDEVNFTLDNALVSHKELPYYAFKQAAAKYYPAVCIIHAFKRTEAGTVVVLSAGALGVRKEIVS